MQKKRLSFNDDFELLYLRHEYIEKVNKLGKTLDPSLIEKYAGIVHTTAKLMFAKLKPNFQKVGFDEDDFVAISNMYMLSYMALYSIQTNPEEMRIVTSRRGDIDENEILRIDRNRLINFLRQRLYHCSTLFARKARNITVGEDKRGFYAETKNSKPIAHDMLFADYKKFGFRKITRKEYKEAQQLAKTNRVSEIKDNEGFKIIKIEQLNNGLSEYDFQLLTTSERGAFYNPPDVVLQNSEEETALEVFRIKFEKMNAKERNKILIEFLKKNDGNKGLREELRLAKKMLNSETIVV